MTKTTVTFGRLKEFLESFGFTHEHVPGVRELFTHPCGTILLYPAYRVNQYVLLHHLMMTRRQLVENGFVENDKEFERQLEEKQTA
jgi:hypothetical protein